MHISRVIVIFLALVITASCSEKSGVTTEAKPSLDVATPKEERANESEAQEESAQQPPEDEIAEDCVAFIRSTKTAPAHGAKADCPQCLVNPEEKEVLKFDAIQVDRVTRSESTCEVQVTIHATFNPSTRESIAGGLTAWISPEQRAKYLQGEIPSGPQVYKVKVIYKRSGKRWRAVEFDRP